MRKERDGSNRELILGYLGVAGPQTITKLSQVLNVSRPTIYLHLEVLEKKGLIERKKDPKRKGSPVIIYRKESKIKEAKVKAIVSTLKMIQDSKSHDFNDLALKFEGVHFPSSSYFEAKLRGFISQKIYLTDEGKKFLKENCSTS